MKETNTQNKEDTSLEKLNMEKQKMEKEYREYLVRMLNGSAPIEQTIGYEEYVKTA
ncbi:MAG: hypothetical protein KKF48_03780 [Nanoarchaeota archaeon]|nr:hypothetical protein [Nanoarchaeota archaeon]